MYKVLIIGHNKFPEGFKSALDLILGTKDYIDYKNLNNNEGHEKFNIFLEEYLINNENVIILADLTGGAPHQLVANIIFKNKLIKHLLVSGVNLSLLIEISMFLDLHRNINLVKLNEKVDELIVNAKISIQKMEIDFNE